MVLPGVFHATVIKLLVAWFRDAATCTLTHSLETLRFLSPLYPLKIGYTPSRKYKKQAQREPRIMMN